MAIDPVRVKLEEAAERADSAASAFYQVLINDRDTPVPVEGGTVDSMSKRIYDQVGGSIDTLEEAAVAAESAVVAANAAVATATAKADEASASADAANTAKTDAQAARDLAQAAATAASTSAGTATTKATEAAASATSAATSAGNASTSAGAASASANSAQDSATSAATSAGTATAAASTATTAKNDAVSAKNAAVTAKTAAEAAASAAQDSAASATASASAAGNSSATATTKASEAAASAAAANAAKTAAELAKSDAQTSAQNAAFSAASAQTSEQNALISANAAADSAAEFNGLADELRADIATKVDKVAGKGLSTNDFTNALKTKLDGIATQATKNQTDAYLLSRANHTGTQAISTVSGLQAALDGKAALSSKNNFTNNTASTSPTTGAQTIAGGLGVGGAIHTGSTPSWLSPDSQTAPMVFIKDAYRQQVEAASGGRQTVLYTTKGQPSVMSIIPVFNLEDIDPSLGTGPHPMFVVGGVTKRERFIGTYPGSVINGELLSLPGVDPSASRNFDSFVSAARANGSGWGIMTNADWAGVSLWCWKNGFMPRGNTDYGRAHDAPYETGRRQDSALPGDTTGTARTLTGSGPVSWRHDNSASGIADLCGNVWEWAAGMRIVDGEIHVIANNDAALTATDLAAGSTAWRAIDGATGELVAPGHANAVKYAASGTAAYTLVRASEQSFEGMTNPGSTPVSSAALQKLKSLGLFPAANTGLGGDVFWHNLPDERLPIRGGRWNSGTGAGVFALNLINHRSDAHPILGARPAFVI